jgi:HD-like signal output (HDOD) protein
MRESLQTEMRKRMARLDRMPTIPAVLAPLLRYLEQPLDRLETQQVVDLISIDKALAGQCLQMANSPILGRSHEVENVRDAVVALGLERMRDIALSCSLLTLLPQNSHDCDIEPVVFWEHSLGCALVCREFARKIGFSDPGKAYLAGLLHDIGIIAHLWVFPREYQAVLRSARTEHIALDEAEQKILGFTHCATGEIVAERWQLSPDLAAVIACHHHPANAAVHRDLVALVNLSDLLCRMWGLGHGYLEERQVNFVEEPAFFLLLEECPALRALDWERFTFELEAYMEEVHRLVGVFDRVQP